MSATPKLADVRSVGDMTNYFRSLPGIREQEEQLARELAASRADLIAKLAAVRARRAGTNADGRPDAKSQLARLAKAFETAAVDVSTAKEALEAAYGRQREAQQAMAGHGLACDLELGKLEAALVETADPRISEFIEWCFLAIDKVRREGYVPSSWREKRDPITGELVKVSAATPPSATARIAVVVDAIRAAIDAAMALRLAPAPDASPELLKLAASIPNVDVEYGIDRATLAKILRDDDDSRAGSWMSRLAAGSGQ